MSNPKVAVAICILALVVGGIFYVIYPTKEHYDNPRACTQEAKQCPDGSYVGRTGPNCEFANCPNGIPPGAVMEDGTIPEGSQSTSTNIQASTTIVQ